MSAVSWNLRLRLNAGQGDAMRVLMDEMIAATREESGCLGYEWFIDEAAGVVHINEAYADSAAVMVHLGNFGAKFAERFMGVFSPEGFTVFGPASAEVKSALAAFGPAYMATLDGFRR